MAPSSAVRVLFVAHSGDGYGANHSLLDILTGLDRTCVEPYLLAGNRGLLTELAEKAGIPVYTALFRRWTRLRFLSLAMPVNLLANFFSAVRIAFLAKRLGIRLIYTNTAGVLSSALAARLAGVPHIWHVREEVSERPLEFKVIHKLSEQIVVNSRATQNRFSAEQRAKTTVIYNGFKVPAESGAAARLEAQTRENLAGKTVLTLVGSIDERKGQKEAVQAMPEILKRFPSAVLVLVGKCLPHTADYENEVTALVKELGLEASVLFYGFKADVEAAYAFTDILLVPSRYEAFGRVIVEGMLAGVPVIATNIGGIPEIIDHDRTGILTEGRNAAAIASAVNGLLENPDRCARIARAGRAAAIEKFGMENMVRSVQGQILRVVGE